MNVCKYIKFITIEAQRLPSLSSQVLLLLQKGGDATGRESQGAPGTTKDNFYTPQPVVPPLPLSLPPSVVPARSPEDQYLTPRIALLESEHVYEELDAVARWSSSKKSQGKANKAFEKVLPKGGSCDGT